ncbi:tautomerase family protein [Mesorhizobium sp. 1B3]|uniref:tautomerase family protein n=1 Tax=Mesorhizobium sp. 1B3 TaxID=3243599 RepID=UPI003D99DE0C
MPLTQIFMRKGRTEIARRELQAGIYEAMRQTFAVPEDDRFMIINELEGADFWFGRSYPGLDRSDDLIIIQITVSNNRTREQKLALYKAVNHELSARIGCRPDDIFINIVEVMPENWSFGQGRAQNIE